MSIKKIEAFFLDEIEARRWQVKKKKRLNKATRIVDTGLITSVAITGGTSIPAFASDVGLPVGAVLGVLGVVLSLLTGLTRNFSSSQTVKQRKHDAIILLSHRKLDSINDIISQAIQD